MPMSEAAKYGDLFVTVTGDINVLSGEHFKVMKDGSFVCNAGHFDVEINIPELRSMSEGNPRTVRPFVEEYAIRPSTGSTGSLQAGSGQPKRIYVLAEGRLVNLAAAEGHPASVMDMSFATQALSCEFMARGGLKPGVYDVPQNIEEMVARTKLAAMGLSIDKLTPEQEKYLSSWQEGT